MDQFPETFNRKVCNDVMTQNQATLIKEVRKTFYELVQEAISSCSPIVVLEFPEKLWHEHRLTLIKELIERFGKIKIQTSNIHCETTKLITSVEDVPNFVKKVLVEFVKEN